MFFFSLIIENDFHFLSLYSHFHGLHSFYFGFLFRFLSQLLPYPHFFHLRRAGIFALAVAITGVRHFSALSDARRRYPSAVLLAYHSLQSQPSKPRFYGRRAGAGDASFAVSVLAVLRRCYSQLRWLVLAGFGGSYDGSGGRAPPVTGEPPLFGS